MKLALSLIALAALPASAQFPSAKQPAPKAVSAKAVGTIGGGAAETVPGSLPAMEALEKDMDKRLATTGGADPSIVLGTTRGTYIPGFGAVFTAEVDLVNTPMGGGPFAIAITPETKAAVRKRKLDHAKLLQATVRDAIASLAASPLLKLSDNDQVVVSVRLMYRPWEDTKDLPAQVVARLDRRGSTPKLEVQ